MGPWPRSVVVAIALALLPGCRRAAVPAAAAGHLAIRPMRIRPVTAGGGGLPRAEAAMVLHADGTVEFQGRVVATVHGDGRLVDPAGTELARLEADGTIGGNVPAAFREMTIGRDGVVRKAGTPLIAIDEAGVATPSGGEAMIRLEGPPEGRQAAIFVFLLAGPP